MATTTTGPATFIRFGEVCGLLGMSRDSGYMHLRSATFPIPVVKVGAIYKCRRADVEAFVNGEANK